MFVLAAGLSIPDPRERPVEKPQVADQAHAPWKDENSDYIGWLKIWNALVTAGAFETNGNLRRFCRKNYLNFTRTREWRNLAADLADSMKEKFSFEPLENTSYQLLHEALLTGIPRNIGQLDTENRVYRGIDGKKFTIFPGSGLAKVKKLPPWIVCFAFVETRALFGRNAAVIEPEWVMNAVPHLCSRSCDQEHFESSSGFVRAREKVSLGALQISAGKKIDFARFNPTAAREIFIRDGLLEGAVKNCPAVEKFNAIRQKLLTYEERMRRMGQLYDESAAEEFFRTNLPMEANSVQSLNNCFQKNKLRWNFSEKDFMNGEVDFSPADYPGKLEFAGVSFKLFYRFAPGEENDGVTIAVPENSLNLLPVHLPEYPVAGYAADFAEVMMRALPKDVRRQIGGIAQCAELFADEFRRDASIREIPPAEAMADFLKTAVDLDVHPKIFSAVKMPEYLQMKIAVLNESGRVKSIERTLPDRSTNSSKVSAALPGAEKHRDSGWAKWDESAGVIPQKVELPPKSGKVFYCALHFDKEKGLISKELFIKQPEADRNHRRAVCELVIKENAQFVKILKRGIKLSNELKLTLLVNSKSSDFEADLLYCAMRDSTDTDPVSVRSKADFDCFTSEVLSNWSNTLDEHIEELESFTKNYSEIRQSARRAKGAAPAIEEHLELLFTDGFLKRPAVFSDYRRYLRALTLRARRAADAPGKDIQKSEQLDIWFERFNAALATLDALTDSDGLYNFWELLEEARIAVFAPEVKTAIKSPVAKLETAWEDLRI
jgi:ATP-dependent helicase HrpA